MGRVRGGGMGMYLGEFGATELFVLVASSQRSDALLYMCAHTCLCTCTHMYTYVSVHRHAL